MRSHPPMRLLSAWALVLAFIAVPSATAQPLADKVPDDALVYVGWRGTDDLGPGYAGSHLKEFLDASQMRQLIEQFVPQLLARVGQEDRQAAAVMQVAATVIPILVKHPTALYIGPVEDLGTRQPKPHIAFMCDAGNDAATLSNIVNRLMAQVPPNGPVPIHFETQGSLVTLTVGVVKLEAGKSLATNTAFTDAMGQVSDDGGKSASAVGYVNYELMIALIDRLALQDDMANGIWQNVREASGVGGLKRIAWAAGFDGKDWGMRAFIAAPKPRTGLLSLGDNEPLGDDLLKTIPASATTVFAARFDFAKLMTVARGIATKVGVSPQLDQGLAQVNGMLGIDLEKDLFGPLGDQWAVYSSPLVGGQGLLGLVLVARPRDAARLEQSLTTLEQLVNRMTAKEDGRRNPKITFVQARDGDLTMHYLATPLLTPTWAVRDGTLIGGLSPQSVSAAAGSLAANGKTILDNESFQSLRQRVKGEKASSLSFIDLPRTAPEGYPFVLLASRLVGFGDLFGVPSPAMLLPPLPKLMPILSPAGGAAWADDAGIHARAVTPFPGAEMFGGSSAMMGPALALGPVMAGVAVPAFARAREQAKAVSSLSNLRQIGVGAIMYSNEYRGVLPPDLGSIGIYVGSPQTFCAPDSGFTAPLVPQDKLRDWINQNSSYVYVGRGRKLTTIQHPSETILAHEKLQFSRNGRIGVVFMDGHAEIIPVDDLQRRLAPQ